MYLFPTFKKLKTDEAIQQFGDTYASCSGLPVPMEYLNQNDVYAFYYRQEMISGFVLANGPSFRTINLFSNPVNHEQLYKTVEKKGAATELCCFWIARAYCCKTRFSLFIWTCLAFALRFYARDLILFGTNSRRLAQLYAGTPHSILINCEQLGTKLCHIFLGQSSLALNGIGTIISKKLRRVLNIKKQRSAAGIFSRLLPQT